MTATKPTATKPSRIYLPHNPAYLHGTLLDFFSQHFAHIPRDVWQARFADGLITDTHGNAQAASAPYRAGQTLQYFRAVANEPVIAAEPTVLHLDAHLLVIDKPHGLPVIPTGQYVEQTVLAKLRRNADLLAHHAAGQLDIMAISPLHRLDKDTAGVMLLSVNPASRGIYQQGFAKHTMHKVYHAIAPTRTDLTYPYRVANRIERGEPFFLSQIVAGEPNAVTDIELLRHGGAFSHYQLTPLTGKKHQLRVHMASLGMPLLNDRLYPVVQPLGTSDPARPLQLLAKVIDFIDPISGQARQFISQQTLVLCSES
ncbi:pseudouridine synthase [Moraxella atlantae]|uniref:Ribosomal large subunit pseudouridine synthase A n=1 Tax=Faucicola atlantae TaxID=34059 RepID=A0A378Q3S3_9GAMM|nr:pseudouridine synthase [Moraxella atlantae]OPH34731.1 pseudouridine synthase [Moraxella atlantae]STY95342.1 Ribosomal large subunit pseudouridine synthase A [Moraxella atlantae]